MKKYECEGEHVIKYVYKTKIIKANCRAVAEYKFSKMIQDTDPRSSGFVKFVDVYHDIKRIEEVEE